MNYTIANIIFFSPTHTSAKIARAISHGTGIEHIEEKDLTYDLSNEPIIIKNKLVILAVPVYAGRVAPAALTRIKRIKAENCPAILVAVYGNRDYEDALVELRDAATDLGFTPLSAGAFIGEHSYSRENMPIAAGRPNVEDLALAELFGKKSMDKLNSTSSLPLFHIKGNVPYKEVAPSTPVAPSTQEDVCSVCGQCMDLCPTKAIFINEKEMIESDKMKCIKCCACVKECPSEARVFDTPYTAMLHKNCSNPREPELFF